MKPIIRLITFSFLGSLVFYFATLILGHEICPLRTVRPRDEFPRVSYLDSINKTLAIPALARKYDTSCQTCHTAFPNLTPFGKAFKKNGMRWPGEGYDPDFKTADSPLALGADAQKYAFPQAVWPGTIPGKVPVAVVGLFQYVSLPESSTANNKNQFQGFGSRFSLLAAGTMGKLFSFWGGANFNFTVNQNTGGSSTDVEIERLYAIYRPFERPVLLFKVGSFEPGLMAISVHRSLLGGYYVTTDKTVGDNGFTLEGAQQGIEISGVPLDNGRFAYTLGVVEGTGNELNNEKDFYGRLEYKIGGLRLDGVMSESDTTTKPWRDDSITLGVFGYIGFANVTNATATTAATQRQQDRFYLLGGDVDINVLNFLINAGFVRQENNHPALATPAASRSTNHFFAEANYVVFPWWIPGVKYELFDSGTAAYDQRLTLGSTFLVRANIKAFLRGAFERVSGGGFFDNPRLLAGAFLAF